MNKKSQRRVPATTVEQVYETVKGYPYTDVANGRILYDHIRRHRLHRVLELGVCHGVGACYAAAAVASLGGGTVVAIDRLESAAYRPSILSFREELGFDKIIIPFFERVTYNWRLRDFLYQVPPPVFDLVFLDGGHSWEPDALAFLLSERLLRPGGWWIFDDINWSISASPTASRIGPGQIRIGEEEIEAQPVRDIVNLLVRPHSAVASWSENAKWGFAHKKGSTGPAADWLPADPFRQRAASSLAFACDSFPVPIVVPPDLKPVDWQRVINRGLEENRKARLARLSGLSS